LNDKVEIEYITNIGKDKTVRDKLTLSSKDGKGLSYYDIILYFLEKNYDLYEERVNPLSDNTFKIY